MNPLNKLNKYLNFNLSAITNKLLHRDAARNGFFSLRKLSKEFVPYSGFVLALREIIANPRWINAWVELLFAEVGTWFYVTNVYMVERRTREQLKYTYLHLFVNRQSKNSLADVVLLTMCVFWFNPIDR